MILQLEHISGGYQKNKTILKNVSLYLQKGNVLAIVGQNGAGKSTIAKAIINILPYRQGKVFFNNIDISKQNTKQLMELGIVYFMQGGRVFSDLSVKENMIFAGLGRKQEIDFDTFPSLKKHWLDEAGLLSGGERHQLALAMALIKKPKLLILDEPSAGLSPVASIALYEILEKVKNKGLSIILIEQNIKNALAFSDQVAIIQNGTISSLLNSKETIKTSNTIQDLFFN